MAVSEAIKGLAAERAGCAGGSVISLASSGSRSTRSGTGLEHRRSSPRNRPRRSAVTVMVVPANEEMIVARDTRTIGAAICATTHAKGGE
jgi:hypothetical protein